MGVLRGGPENFKKISRVLLSPGHLAHTRGWHLIVQKYFNVHEDCFSLVAYSTVCKEWEPTSYHTSAAVFLSRLITAIRSRTNGAGLLSKLF